MIKTKSKDSRKEIEATVTLSSKGQLVIPIPLRLALGITTGSELRLAVIGEKLELTPVHHSIREIFGYCKRKNEKALSLEDMDKAIEESVREENKK